MINFVNGDSSGPASFDCPMRDLILEYSQHIQPFLTKDKLQQVADALNGDPLSQNCNVSVDKLPYQPPQFVIKEKTFSSSNIDKKIATIFIDPQAGKDIIDTKDPLIHFGNINKPFKTIQYGLDYLRSHISYHYDTSNINHNRNYTTRAPKQILLRQGTHYLSDTLHFHPSDSNLKISSYNGEDSIVSGAIPLTNLQWKLYKNSSSNDGKNIYSAYIPSSFNLTSIQGLRVNSTRAIRARYPNSGNPEVYPPGFGSNLLAKHWYGAINNPKPDYVYEPSSPSKPDNPEHLFEHYNLGIGGDTCYNFEPEAGYRCSSTCQGGGTNPYAIPTGMIYNETDLPNAPYANPDKGVVQAWRSGHWASWMFEIGKYDSRKQNISFSKGGFQDGRGSTSGEAYFIENVFEELDYETEWFYNETTRILYYKMNESNVAPDEANLVFEAVKLKVLMNYTGTMDDPVSGMELSHVTFRDSRITYFEPHGLPSGGDWALQRTGSVFLDGCVNFSIHDNVFTRLDNIGISINRYNRYHDIYKNEFVYLGGSAITTWGDTVSDNKSVPDGFGYDGRTGIQPRFINISYNFGHEIGIWEKQSTFYFQAKSCQNTIEHNIIFNGPRSGINFNDGFGGRSLIKKNVIFNTCRESGAHGPINSWDRQPYLTNVRYLNGTSSMEKGFDNVTGNILMANYEANFILDGDDGSNNYHAYNNLFVYGLHGTKSTFGGHNIRHFNNYYGYVGNDCLMSNYAGNTQLGEYSGYNDWYFNNSCIVAAKVGKSDVVLNWGSFACETKQDQWPVLGNNTIYVIGDNVYDKNVTYVGLCNMTESEFQSKYNTDLGTEVYEVTDEINRQFIANAKAMLF